MPINQRPFRSVHSLASALSTSEVEPGPHNSPENSPRPLSATSSVMQQSDQVLVKYFNNLFDDINRVVVYALLKTPSKENSLLLR